MPVKNPSSDHVAQNLKYYYTVCDVRKLPVVKNAITEEIVSRLDDCDAINSFIGSMEKLFFLAKLCRSIVKGHEHDLKDIKGIGSVWNSLRSLGLPLSDFSLCFDADGLFVPEIAINVGFRKIKGDMVEVEQMGVKLAKAFEKVKKLICFYGDKFFCGLPEIVSMLGKDCLNASFYGHWHSMLQPFLREEKYRAEFAKLASQKCKSCAVDSSPKSSSESRIPTPKVMPREYTPSSKLSGMLGALNQNRTPNLKSAHSSLDYAVCPR